MKSKRILSKIKHKKMVEKLFLETKSVPISLRIQNIKTEMAVW
jgi:hypothetical protein